MARCSTVVAPRRPSAALLVVAFAIAAIAAIAMPARADDAGGGGAASGPEDSLNKKIAVWRFDALGIDPEIVQRLETLFRLELGRLDRVPLPSRRDIESKITPAEQNCTGDEKCLTAIGKRLGVDYIVTGTVGSLGDNYVLDVRAVSVATGTSQHVQSDPLKGAPDDLIEGVRVAAYRLLAPDQLHGSLQIQSDLVGAAVTLDGKPLGKTPLPNLGVVSKLPLGKHQLHVEATDYAPFDDAVEVHFQKVSPVVVRLVGTSDRVVIQRDAVVERRPIYTRTWFIAGVAALAVIVGVAVGVHEKQYQCSGVMDGVQTCH